MVKQWVRKWPSDWMESWLHFWLAWSKDIKPTPPRFSLGVFPFIVQKVWVVEEKCICSR